MQTITISGDILDDALICTGPSGKEYVAFRVADRFGSKVTKYTVFDPATARLPFLLRGRTVLVQGRLTAAAAGDGSVSLKVIARDVEFLDKAPNLEPLVERKTF